MLPFCLCRDWNQSFEEKQFLGRIKSFLMNVAIVTWGGNYSHTFCDVIKKAKKQRWMKYPPVEMGFGFQQRKLEFCRSRVAWAWLIADFSREPHSVFTLTCAASWPQNSSYYCKRCDFLLSILTIDSFQNAKNISLTLVWSQLLCFPSSPLACLDFSSNPDSLVFNYLHPRT
jgi:hypothetical protein